jgi:hypothetical protein
MCVCLAPLRIGGIKGEKSTPSVGWEVPVRSQRLASGSWSERKRGTMIQICHQRSWYSR